MNITMTAISFDLSTAMKDKITKRISKIARLGDVIKASVSCAQDKQGFSVKIDYQDRQNDYHASETARDFYQALKAAADKLEQQVIAANRKNSKKGGASIRGAVDPAVDSDGLEGDELEINSEFSEN